jgi:hypothetical protein
MRAHGAWPQLWRLAVTAGLFRIGVRRRACFAGHGLELDLAGTAVFMSTALGLLEAMFAQ